MKRSLVGWACVALFTVGCEAFGPSGTAGETPIPPQSDAGSGRGPSISITVAGAVSGASTQLASGRANHCSSLQSAETISIYSMNLYPVINGTDYHLSVIVGKFHGPITLNVATDNTDGDRITVLFSDASNNGSVWGMTTRTSGTVTIDGSGGGQVDLHDLPAVFGPSTIDLSGRWTC